MNNNSLEAPKTEGLMPTATTQRKRRTGLTLKVILLLLFISLLPVSIYFGLSSKQSAQRITEETTRNGLLVTELLTSEVDEWLDKNIRALHAIAKMPNIISMYRTDQEAILKAIQAEYPWMYLVFTTDPNGINVARSDGKKLKDYSSRQYYNDVIFGSDLAWQNLIGKTSKEPALVLAVPIKENGQTVGVLAAAMTREAISKRVTTFKKGQTGSSFLVDQTGVAVAHRNNTFVLTQQDMSKHPLVITSAPGAPTTTEFIDGNGKETIGFSKKTQLGWVLAIQQEKGEAFESLKKAQKFAYSLLGITVLVILIIAYFASRAIVDPIKKLTDAANKISFGELDVEIIKTSKDELGDLAEAITRMQDSIKISISRLKRRK